MHAWPEKLVTLIHLCEAPQVWSTPPALAISTASDWYSFPAPNSPTAFFSPSHLTEDRGLNAGGSAPSRLDLIQLNTDLISPAVSKWIHNLIRPVVTGGPAAWALVSNLVGENTPRSYPTCQSSISTCLQNVFVFLFVCSQTFVLMATSIHWFNDIKRRKRLLLMDWITIVAGGNNLKEVNLRFTGLSSCSCVDRKHLPLARKGRFLSVPPKESCCWLLKPFPLQRKQSCDMKYSSPLPHQSPL